MADSGAAEKVMPRSMFPEISTEEMEKSKNGKGFKGPGGEHVKNYGQQVMSVRALDGVVRKSTWQVVDVRRPLVSASHIIQAGNDLSIGKDEAYIMNRRRKEKSMLRKEENVYVLDLFVKVPPSAVAPSKYKPMEVDAINQVADERKERRRVTFDSNSPTFWRAETVRPQLNERCEKQRERDSVLSARNNENDVELNGETDDEDMEDGEMGFDDGSAQAINIRDPGQPNAKEHQEHMTINRPYSSRCKFCVMARGVNAPHRRSDAQDDLEGGTVRVDGLWVSLREGI